MADGHHPEKSKIAISPHLAGTFINIYFFRASRHLWMGRSRPMMHHPRFLKSKMADGCLLDNKKNNISKTV